MNIAGYAMYNQVYESPNSIVYRARRKDDDLPVILKILKEDYPTPQELGRYRQEYTITTGFESDGVIKTYSLEPYQHTLMMILEDFGAISLQQLLPVSGFPVRKWLAIAIRVAEIVGEVHAANVIHKDINPSNIVMNPDTSQIKLIDFGIATQLPRENPVIVHPNVLEGTLAYISPEQTGRMNRSLDYRADFYSLGVTLYELLTGVLPFTTTDPMELVHAHIAVQPEPPHAIQPEIPEPVSAIIMKLLAKNAEDRYQSAFGITADLKECLRQVDASGAVTAFPICSHDISARFHIPDKLYGREQEIAQLLAHFDQVCQGSSKLMLVSGFSGIGKSALINEIQKPVVARKGLFIAGKFDQFARDLPYSAIAQAFRTLCRYLLMEPKERLETWKMQVLHALGPNTRILLDLVPQWEMLLGPQPPAPELGPSEAQNRFQFVVKDFVRVFATAEHPLVVFIDDLQWADIPSLSLLTALMADPDIRHLFLIGAYRDNEVEAGHPLLSALETMRNEGNQIESIYVAPLKLPDLTRLVAETVQCGPETALPLARLIYHKTGGNPFFGREFLLRLYRDNLLNFDPAAGQWTYHPEQIEQAGITENVVEFMAGKLHTLLARTQEILQLAACLGNTFDLNSLAIIGSAPAAAVAHDLQEALQQELVVPLSAEYKYLSDETTAAASMDIRFRFQHDRVQQAAYGMIEQAQRQQTHLAIGRLMREHLNADEQEERLIEMVRHLNEGRQTMTTASERETLASLNLRASRKARNAIAYQAAVQYADIGLELLPDERWDTHYELTLALSQEYTQAAYLSGYQAEAEQQIRIMLDRIHTPLEKAEILWMQAVQYSAMGKRDAAIRTGIEGLALLGVKLSIEPGLFSLLKELLLFRFRLGRRSIADLIDLPVLTDHHNQMIMKLLMEIGPAAYLTGKKNLIALASLKMTMLSLRWGNSPETVYGYTTNGLLSAAALGNLKAAYAFGKLALALDERFQDRSLQGRVLFLYTFFIQHWNTHWSQLTPFFRKGMQAAYQAGDLLYFTANCGHTVRWDPTLDLVTMSEELQKYVSIIQKTDDQNVLDSTTTYHQMVLNFRGRTDGRLSMNDDSFDENQCIERMQACGYLLGILSYYACKAEICCMYDEYAAALEYIKAQQKNIHSLTGMPFVVKYCFLTFLSFAGCYSEMPTKERARAWKRMAKEQKQMKKWAEYCPVNFLHRLLMMEAELARLSEKPQQASELYDQAIKAAHEHEWPQHEALANELAAKFYLSRGQEKIAGVYMQEARYLYSRWGAARKVEFLEERYPQLLTQARTTAGRISVKQGTTTPGTTNLGAELDLHTVMKASHSLSGEIVLANLLTSMMRIMLENAGAQRGTLLLIRDGQVQSVARASVEKGAVILTDAAPLEQSDDLPVSVVQYVARTQESLVLSDAAHKGNFTQDAYILRTQPKSVFCMPMIAQGKLNGLLYLENNLTTGAFTTDRIEVLNLLSSQAAISIENATLYARQVALTEASQRFVPFDFLKILGKASIVDANLGDQIHGEMTILFSDIRSYTTLAEGMTPQEVFNFTNGYHNRMTPVIRANQGFVQQFQGDGTVAVFPGAADDAIRAAISLQQAVQAYNRERKQKRRQPIRVGIGLHTGPLMIGIIGDAERWESGVPSDTVNTAARMEGLTKFYGVSVVISEDTLKRLPESEQYHLRFIDRVQAKGKERVIEVYELYESDPESVRTLKKQTQADFEEGQRHYVARAFAEAILCFQRVLEKNPDDKTAQLYLDRASHYLSAGVPEDWHGIEQRTTK